MQFALMNIDDEGIRTFFTGRKFEQDKENAELMNPVTSKVKLKHFRDLLPGATMLVREDFLGQI